jgi:acyl-homoserine-lactone acylase
MLLFAASCSSSAKSANNTTTAPPATSPVATTTATTASTTAVGTTPVTSLAAATTAALTTTVAPGYSASITRTRFGIAHIVAADWGGVGFGQGYAFAQDRACTLIDQVIKVRGERSKWFGAGDKNANVESDFAYLQLGLHDSADRRFGSQPKTVADMVSGYVAGFNAELKAEGPHGWCSGQPWVQAITTTDLYAYLNDVLLFASSGVLLPQIAGAQPPAAAAAAPPASGADRSAGSLSAQAGSPLALPALASGLGSNGWSIGSALSENGGGMLLANPHFPWEGEKRLWESQLTITDGSLNVYGASLSGVPGVLIGFNDHVAWTHTVSAGYRMTLYELQLTPGDPTSYAYGTSSKKMTSKQFTIDVKQTDGTTVKTNRTMWSSHYGPMIQLPFGWTDSKAYTMRDANLDNADTLKQFFGMDAAKSMDEFIAVHRTANGVPWVNTIATSADGRAWYADTAATPNLSDKAIAMWQAAVQAGGVAKAVLDNGAILLNGSDPENEWVDDPTATRPGILPFAKQPQIERNDFVFNANDSHWLANPAQLLTGYSPLTGPEAVPQSPRTRENVRLVTDPAVRGADNKLSLTELQAAIFSNRGLAADLLLPSVLADCDAVKSVVVDKQPFDLAPACAVLHGWDGRYNVSSKGAPLFREFLRQFGSASVANAGTLYKVPFDATDPVGTPNTLNPDRQVVLTNLAKAAKGLVAGGFAVDAALGDMQFDDRQTTERIPLPGGRSIDGTPSVVGCCSGSHTLAPRGDPGTFSDTYAYSTKGYPVSVGDSFMMTLEFTKAGPHAAAVLTYGQPDDPASPDFTSQTKLFSAGQFRPVLFTPDDIKSDSSATTVTVTGTK